jgi:hypothetical protein
MKILYHKTTKYDDQIFVPVIFLLLSLIVMYMQDWICKSLVIIEPLVISEPAAAKVGVCGGVYIPPIIGNFSFFFNDESRFRTKFVIF